MKLVFITDAWRPVTGGGQKLYEEVLSRLAEKGWQIIVVTRALKGSRPNCLPFRVVRLGPALPFFNSLGRVWFTVQSFFYCLKLNPDRFIATTWLPALTLQLIKLVKKTPVVLLAIGFGSRFKWLEDLITKKFKYDLVITDDWTFKEAKFIPNGVAIPKKQGVKKYSRFSFLFIGRNEPRKGVEILKQALIQVQRHDFDVSLRLFGPGFKLISQEQLDQEMFKAQCLVLPSLREGHPLILFEAWAHRLPVIATNVGSVPQFVNHKNGYLVSSGNVSALAQAMIKAIHDKNLSQKGLAGFNLVKNYTWDKTAEKYHLVLSRLVA